MTDLYAVIGNPIGHSRSPTIHAAFARQTGQDLEYIRILGDPRRFADDVRDFIERGGRGLNVTVPFKEQAWRLADECGEAARNAAAVNTLTVLADGRLRGDNTDGTGLIRDLTDNLGLEVRARRLLLLGAGGAARGVARPLLEAGPKKLVIANRTASRAVALAASLSAFGDAVRGCGLDGIRGQRFDLVVNGTAAGLMGAVPAIPDDCLTPGGSCYDMMYSDEPTAFVRWARDHGASQAVDGLGMLVEQAAESFYLWRGVRPATAAVIRQLGHRH